jgi:stage II sporulation protein D
MASGSVLRALRRSPALLATLSAAAALPAAAQATAAPGGHAYPHSVPHVSEPSASGFYIRGGGDGHGIGLSQYGTLGYAQHRWSYQRILARYYQGTGLGSVSPSDVIRVLLSDGSARFSGASSKVGDKTLKPGTTYTVGLSSGKLVLKDGSTKVATVSPPLTVSGSGPLTLAGLGQYRGDFVFRPDGSGGVQTVNALDLEDYVRGVISAEMPSSWPAQALRAQAVAARTYALTSGSAGSTFDVYSDTRSQMYEGVRAETPATDAAVSATRGKVVTYHGAPVVTYFSSSSGGHTESIQNVWPGSSPEPWLRGVPDPYDGAGGNPNHRWAYNLSVAAASRKLGGLVKGSLVGIRVLKHGVSPRIVRAAVVGTRGSSDVTGPALQQDFGLMSTYMAFTTVNMHGAFSASTSGGSSSGGASAGSGPAGGRTVAGRVYPTHRGVLVLVQKLEKRTWKTVRRARTVDGGHYRAGIPGPGRYRIKYGNVGGPALTIR